MTHFSFAKVFGCLFFSLVVWVVQKKKTNKTKIPLLQNLLAKFINATEQGNISSIYTRKFLDLKFWGNGDKPN